MYCLGLKPYVTSSAAFPQTYNMSLTAEKQRARGLCAEQ